MALEERRATEDEVIHAFLHEVDSPRYAEATLAALVAAGGSRRLVDEPDLRDEHENAIRRAALADVRGWGRGVRMFAGFPEDIEWSRGLLDAAEVERLRYIDYSYWNELSGGSRRIIGVEQTLRDGTLPEWLAAMGTQWCHDLADRYRVGLQTPEIIVLATPDLGSIVVVEGHARITGIVLSGVYRERPVSAFIGRSDSASMWMA